MRWVLGNRLLGAIGGTEAHLLTVGEELRRLGHEVWLYSPELGEVARVAERRGLEVTDEIRRLPEACEVVFSQDTQVVYDLSERFPGAFHVFRVCGEVFDFQLPPQIPDVADLVVALNDRYARVAEGCAVKAPILRMRAPIDFNRLIATAPIRERPRRAVLLGNYGERTSVVREAWEPEGIEIERIGIQTAQSYDLSASLADVDIVVAKTRAVLDAMACGKAVYVLDAFGGDGWVTRESYAVLEADSFNGTATERVVGVADLRADLAGYDPRMGQVNRDLITQHHGVRDHVLELLRAIGEREPSERPAVPMREISRLTSLQWSWEGHAHHAHGEIASLVARAHGLERRLAEAEQVAASASQRVAEAEQRAADAHARLERERAELTFRLDAMRATRAWRLAGAYWRARGLVSKLLGRARR